MQRIFLFLVCTVLVGCTAAQRQVANIQNVTKQAGTEMNACVEGVNNNPTYEPIASHLTSPANGYQPTMSQLADDTHPTKRDSQLLIQYHDELIPCRQAFLQKIQTVTPDVAQVFTEGWVDSDNITMRLIKRKITWGEAAKLKQQNTIETRQKILAVAHQIDSALAASHQAELDRRHAALQQWNQQMQNMNAQIQNNRPRMTTTNCNSFTPNSLNCNSTTY